MKDMDRFERWAARARMEIVPAPDVADAVMRRLAGPARPAIITPSPLVWTFSAASAAAAFICGVLGWLAWAEMNASAFAWLQDFSNWGAI